MKSEIFIMNQYDTMGNHMGVEVFTTITNTYPLFKKTELDINKYNNPLANYEAQMEKETFGNYSNRAQMHITNYMDDTYRRLGNTSYNTILEEFKDFTINQIIDNKLKLLFIKSTTDLILLNYFEENGPLKYIPDDVFGVGRHIYNFTHNKQYRVINTYHPFLGYCKINSIPIEYSSNKPLFESFVIAFRKSSNINDGINTCVNESSGESYNYYMFKQNIIIISYSRNIIKNYGFGNVLNPGL